MTESESYISYLNSVYFFKEFTFSSNKFKTETPGIELELADNVIWIDNLLFVSQIKERNKDEENDIEKWFTNKVINKAVKQIKNTISYLNRYDSIIIKNDRGHEFDVSKIKKLNALKLIIYSPKTQLSELMRFKKFYESKSVGLIHLFHIEDYLWICKYLVTPIEIHEYLKFREKLFFQTLFQKVCKRKTRGLAYCYSLTRSSNMIKN